MSNFIEMQSQDRGRNLRRIFALLLLAVAFVLLPAISRADTTAAYKINGTLSLGEPTRAYWNSITTPSRI